MKEEKEDNTTALSQNDLYFIEKIEEINSKIHVIYKQFLIIFLICLTSLISVLVWFFLYLGKKEFLHIIILVVVIILSIVFTLFSGLVTLIKLILDRRKIYAKLIRKFSTNFIIANFWNGGKRFYQETCLIKNNAKIIASTGVYLINQSCAWIDHNRRINLFYFEGVPNPINLNFEKNLSAYKNANVLERKNLKDSYGNLLDVGFDSQSLKIFEDNITMNQLVKEKGDFPFSTILIIIFAIIIIGVLVFIAYSLTQGNSHPATTATTTATTINNPALPK